MSESTDIQAVIVRGTPLPELDVHARIRFALADPGTILPRGDNYSEPLADWQARAIEVVLGIDTSTHPHPAFHQRSLIEIACAECGYVLDEDGDGTHCFPTRAEAADSAHAQGWHRLADRRLICAADDDDHLQALAAAVSTS